MAKVDLSELIKLIRKKNIPGILGAICTLTATAIPFLSTAVAKDLVPYPRVFQVACIVIFLFAGSGLVISKLRRHPPLDRRKLPRLSPFSQEEIDTEIFGKL